MTKHMDPKLAKQIIEEIRTVLNEWDFIGILPGDGGPADEYDCLIGKLTHLTTEGVSRKKVKAGLRRELKEHFGFDDTSHDQDHFENALDKLMAVQYRNGFAFMPQTVQFKFADDNETKILISYQSKSPQSEAIAKAKKTLTNAFEDAEKSLDVEVIEWLPFEMEQIYENKWLPIQTLPYRKDEFNYINAVEILDRAFPEFVASTDYPSPDDRELRYVDYGYFAKYIEKAIKDQNEAVVEKFFQFINKMYSIPNLDPELENLIAVELFEPFLLKEYYEMFTNKLEGLAKSNFRRMYNWTPA